MKTSSRCIPFGRLVAREDEDDFSRATPHETPAKAQTAQSFGSHLSYLLRRNCLDPVPDGHCCVAAQRPLSSQHALGQTGPMELRALEIRAGNSLSGNH